MRLERVLLVNPPLSLRQVYGRYASGAPKLPPLGFCYIAAILEGLELEVRLLDCVAGGGSALPDVEKAIWDFRPQMVGVTSTTVSFHAAKEVVALARRLDPSVVTVLGGAHVSAMPRETPEELPGLDVGVVGEGEHTVAELVAALKADASLSGIAGLCWREGAAVRMNPRRANEPDLNRFPRPARRLLPDLANYSPNPFRGYGRAVSLISSRGCTFDCSYCDQSVFSAAGAAIPPATCWRRCSRSVTRGASTSSPSRTTIS